MKRSRSIAIAATIASSALLLIPGGASAAIDSRLTIGVNDSGSRIGGFVKSQRPRCERNREIVLYYRGVMMRAGDGPPFEPVASDSSNRRGKWSIEGPGGNVPPGDYYAKVARKGDCAGDRSKTIRYRGSGPTG